jgi:chemotaxis protein MotB
MDENPRKKKKKKVEEGAPEWLVTYSDMVTLLLVFFITLMSLEEIVEPKDFNLFTINYAGIGQLAGGNTLSKGKMAELGNNINTMPSAQREKRLERSREAATSLFKQEMESKVIREVRMEQRGLVITLAADSFFRPASAEVDIERNRVTLQKISSFLTSDAIRDLNFRIEGHTDRVATDLSGPWGSNWELSVMRSVNIFQYLLNYSQMPRAQFEEHFELAGYGDTKPIMDNDTPEGRAYNRRIDIVVLSPGNLSLPQEAILQGN